MGNPPGSFVWYELLTPDQAGAARFYSALAGWTFTPADPGAAIDYGHFARSDGGSAGGVMTLSPAMQDNGARPCWLPYLSVPDVDQAVSAIVSDGGRVLMPKMSIEVGSFALVTDPMGTPFYIMTPVPPADSPNASSDVFSASEPQHMRWNELASPDLARAKSFYAKHFGFEFNNSMPMGEMGDYCFIDHHGVVLGAIMQQGPHSSPQWLPYIGVSNLLAAKQAVETNGGTVLNGPHEVPGGDWIVVARDPQGALFGAVGPRGA